MTCDVLYHVYYLSLQLILGPQAKIVKKLVFVSAC